jgi:primosomal protein N''
VEALAANESGAVAKTEKMFEEALQSIKPGIEEARGLTDLIKRPAEQKSNSVSISTLAQRLFSQKSVVRRLSASSSLRSESI